MANIKYINGNPLVASSVDLADGSLSGSVLTDGTVTMSKLGNDVQLDIEDGSVTTAKIADGAVTSDKLSPDVRVQTDKTLSVDDMAADSVTVGTMLDGITPFSLADGVSVTTGKSVKHADGGLSTNANCTATDYIDVSGSTSIVYARCKTTGSSSPASGMAFYDVEKEYISGQKLQYGAEVATYSWQELAVPEGAKYARFTYLNSLTDFWFAVYDADEYYASVKGVSKHAADYMRFNEEHENLWGYGNYVDGVALNSSGTSTSSNSSYMTTDYFPVNEGEVIYGWSARFHVYGESTSELVQNGTFANNATPIEHGYMYTIPEGGKYMRVCVNPSVMPAFVAKVSPYEEYLKAVAEGLDGEKLKLYCIGDSITRGMYAPIGAQSSTGPTSKGYPYWVGQINNYEVVNLGESGGGYANKGINSKNGKDIVDENTFDGADIVTIAFGVNDYKGNDQNVTLGSMDSPAGDGSTIGNMKYMIEQINAKAPTAQLIIMLPMNEKRFSQGTLETNWAFGYAFRENKTLADYRAAIRACAEYYNLKVVDEEEVTPINRLNIASVLGDGLHPTLAYYKQMGHALAPYIQ